jgi:hypothetical protein
MKMYMPDKENNIHYNKNMVNYCLLIEGDGCNKMKKVIIFVLAVVLLAGCSAPAVAPVTTPSQTTTVLMTTPTSELTPVSAVSPSPTLLPLPTQTYDISQATSALRLLNSEVYLSEYDDVPTWIVAVENLTDRRVSRVTFWIQEFDKNGKCIAEKKCSDTWSHSYNVICWWFEDILASKDITVVKIVKIHIEYIDGSILDIPQEVVGLLPTATPEPSPTPLPDLGPYKAALQVLSISISKPNSVGGVNCTIKFKNTSKMTINYVEFSVDPINGVGDPIGDDIDPSGPEPLVYTGPLAPGKTATKTFKNAWYNAETKRVALTDINITYSDDSEFDIPQDIIAMLNIKGNYVEK